MPVIKIKATVEKKDEKLKNVRDIIRMLDPVYADEELLVTFKDKFRDWTCFVLKEWRSHVAEKPDEFLGSTIFRASSTTLIFVAFFEFLKCWLTGAPDMSPVTLIAVYGLSLLLMDLTSVAVMTYLRSPSTFFCRIYEYFEMVLCLRRLLNHRISYVQRRMNLERSGQNYLPPDIYAFEETFHAKFSYSSFSLYSFHGIYLALCVFVPLRYFRLVSLPLLKYLTLNLLFLVASSKIFAILKFLTAAVERRKRVQARTDEFKVWFDNECEVKRILQESREDTKIFSSAFSNRTSKFFPSDEYLNFLIFAATCEGIFRSNLDDRDLEKAVLVLLYGQLGVPRDDSRSNEFIRITATCKEHIKSVKILDEDENETVKPTLGKEVKENVADEDNNLATAKTLQNAKIKSKIPRFVCSRKLTPVSSKSESFPVPPSNASLEDLEPNEENLGNLDDLMDNSDPVNHFNSHHDKENGEGITGIPATPSTSPSNTNMYVTFESPLNDETLGYEPPTEGNAELAIHSKSSLGRKTEERDVIETSVTPTLLDSSTDIKSTLQVSVQDQNLGHRKDMSTEQESSSVIDTNSRLEEMCEAGVIGIQDTDPVSVSNAIERTDLQQSFDSENLCYQNGLLAEPKSCPDIHPNSGDEGKSKEANCIGTPETSLISESNAVMKTTQQALFQDKDIREQNESSAKQETCPDIHPNLGNERENTEVDCIETPKTPLISDSNAVIKTTIQAPLQYESKTKQNELSEKQEPYPDIHPNLGNEEKSTEVDCVETSEKPLISDSSAVMKITQQASFTDEGKREQNDSSAKQEACPDIHPGSDNEEKNAEVDSIGTPDKPLVSDSNAVVKISLQDETVREQNESSSKEESYPDIHHNSGNEEKSTKVDCNGTPEIPLLYDSSAVLKIPQQAPLQDESIREQNDSSAKQETYPDIHPGSDNGEINVEVDFNVIPEAPLISDSSVVMKTTLQEPLQDESIREQSDLLAAQKLHPGIQPNEEKSTEINYIETPDTPLISDFSEVLKIRQQAPLQYEDIREQNDSLTKQETCLNIHPGSDNGEIHSKPYFNLVPANGETDIPPNLLLVLDISRNTFSFIDKTDLMNQMDLNIIGKELRIFVNENVEADIPYYSGNEIAPTALNSGTTGKKTEPSSDSATEVMDDTQFGAKISDGGLDKSPGDEVESVSSPLFPEKENVFQGCPDHMDANANDVPHLDAGSVQYLDVNDERNEWSLKGLKEETGTIPDESLEVAGKDESTTENGEMQRCNSLRSSENRGDGFKRPQTGEGENLNLDTFSEEELTTNRGLHEKVEESRDLFPNQNLDLNGDSSSNVLSDRQKIVVDDFVEACEKSMSFEEQAEEELPTVQGINPWNENGTMEKLFDNIINQNFDLNMDGNSILNCNNEAKIILLLNALSAFQKKSTDIDESASNLKSSPTNGDVENLSQYLSKLNLQSGDAPSIASNGNIPQGDSNEGHTTTKEVCHTGDLSLTEPKQNTTSDKTLSSSSTQMAKLGPRASVDREQNINQIRFEQNTPSNDVEQRGLAHDCQKTFLARDAKGLNETPSSSSCSIKGRERHTEDADNRNNKSNDNLPHFESLKNPIHKDLKPEETSSLASDANSEINVLKNECSANREMLAEDASNRYGSSGLRTGDEGAQATDAVKAKEEGTSSANFEISEHKPDEDATDNVQHLAANSSALPKTRKISKGKRRIKDVGKNRQADQKVTLGRLQEPENVNRVGTPDSSKISTEGQETTISLWENLIPWGNSTNRNNQQETTKECELLEEMVISQVLNKSGTNTFVVSADVNGVARRSSKNVEEMKCPIQSEDPNIGVGVRDLEGSDPDKSHAFTPVSSNSNSPKPDELISDVTNSVSRKEVDTNASPSKCSQEDEGNDRESAQMNGDFTSAKETRLQASTQPVMKEAQKNATEENMCQQQVVSINRKGESNRKDGTKGERDESRGSHADALRESSRDMPAVNENCDTSESSSCLNRETFKSLNERKIEVADRSQELEGKYVLDNSSLDGRTHSDENVHQESIGEPDGGEKDICNANRPPRETENSQNDAKKAPCKGQSKTKRDSAATKEETGKLDPNFEDKKRSAEVTRKKDQRYLCLQKYRGIVNTERCEFEVNERQASYVSSCEKLSVKQETTSLRMLDKRNGQSENARTASWNRFTEDVVFDSRNKDRDIEDWIRNVSSPESSSTFTERPPTGSSEDDNLHMHPSTSASNSTPSKQTKIFSESSAEPPNYNSLIEEQPSDPGEEFFLEVNGVSDASGEFKKGGMKWQSDLDCDGSVKNGGERGSTADRRTDVEKESTTAVNFRLKCDNLEIRFLDSEPHLTLRFVREAQNEANSIPRTRKLLEGVTGFDSTDEIILPTGESSTLDGHASPLHTLEIPEISDAENVVQMSVEPLGNLDHPNSSARDEDSSIFLDKRSRGNKEQQVAETEKPSPRPLSGNGTLQQSPNEICKDMFRSSKSQDKSAIPSTSKNPAAIQQGAGDIQLNNGEKSEDFVFESDVMKIDYKPHSEFESISVSFRRQRDASKLTFKSPEKKLYLKTSKRRVEKRFSGT